MDLQRCKPVPPYSAELGVQIVSLLWLGQPHLGQKKISHELLVEGRFKNMLTGWMPIALILFHISFPEAQKNPNAFSESERCEHWSYV